MELIQITATYSNAVLMAILPHITDVAKNLDLPITRPVQPSHIRKFVCDPRKGEIGGWVTLTNGYMFWFLDGHVDMESPDCYFHLQNPDAIPRFYGKRRMTEGEAVAMARRAIRKLGHNPAWLETDKPKVEQPGTAIQDRPKVVPRIRVTWQRTALDGRKTTAEVEINTEAKRVEMLTLMGQEFERKQLNIEQPPILPTSPVSDSTPQDSPLKLLLEKQRIAVTNEVCAKASDMAKLLGLPVSLPIRPVDIKESTLDVRDNDLCGAITLKNGYRFYYSHGHVSSFYSQNSDAYEHDFDLSTVYGKVRYTKEQMLDYATKQIRKLGYPDSAVFLDQPPSIGGGPDENAPGYTRFRIWWQKPGTTRDILRNPNAQFVEAEINGMTLGMESLWLRSTNLYKRSIIQR
jgi:hypothetical protein